MKDFVGNTFHEGDIEYTIHEHIAVLKSYEGRESPWTKEANLVSWNGNQPKIDIRDWSESHERMGRGITLTEAEAEILTKALYERFRDIAGRARNTPSRDDWER